MKTTSHFASVTRGGQTRVVKNLGWLLRNWQTLEAMEFHYSPEGMNDGTLVSRHRDGSEYRTEFASLSVFWNWANRSIFKGIPFVLYTHHKPAMEGSRPFVIGSDEWRRVNRLDYKQQMEELTR